MDADYEFINWVYNMTSNMQLVITTTTFSLCLTSHRNLTLDLVHQKWTSRIYQADFYTYTPDNLPVAKPTTVKIQRDKKTKTTINKAVVIYHYIGNG